MWNHAGMSGIVAESLGHGPNVLQSYRVQMLGKVAVLWVASDIIVLLCTISTVVIWTFITRLPGEKKQSQVMLAMAMMMIMVGMVMVTIVRMVMVMVMVMTHCHKLGRSQAYWLKLMH